MQTVLDTPQRRNPCIPFWIIFMEISVNVPLLKESSNYFLLWFISCREGRINRGINFVFFRLLSLFFFCACWRAIRQQELTAWKPLLVEQSEKDGRSGLHHYRWDSVGGSRRAAEADKVAANKAAQEARAIKICWHSICKLRRGHHYKLDLVLIRQFSTGAGGKLDTEFFIKSALKILPSD